MKLLCCHNIMMVAACAALHLKKQACIQTMLCCESYAMSVWAQVLTCCRGDMSPVLCLSSRPLCCVLLSWSASSLLTTWSRYTVCTHTHSHTHTQSA
jgi:hypothetical protein